MARLKTERCQRALQRKATLESTPRLTRINAQGEREFLDEKDLAEEARRNQQDIAENCG